MEIILIIFIVLSIHYFIFLISILVGIKRVIKKSTVSNNLFSVSVIIPFRNEKENLRKNIESLLNQNYSKDKIEIIYVDDNSSDGGSKIIKEYVDQSEIKIVLLKAENVNLDRGHKKNAIAKGIDKSNNEIIITSDADCFYEKNWIKSLIDNFEKDTGIVSGPVEYYDKGGIFSSLQKLEFAGLILSGAGLIGIKNPIICNGANLAFRKNVYYEVGGYKSHLNFSSGDDEFLMQKIAYKTEWNVNFAFRKDALVFTNPADNISSFLQQRKRWASKSLYYLNNKIKLKLILIFLFYLLLIIVPVSSIFTDLHYLFIFLSIFSLKLVLEFLILLVGKKKLFIKIEFKYYIIAQLIQPVYIVISSFTGLFGKFNWKGRNLDR